MEQAAVGKSILFCFCGPGGSGKSTICRELVAALPSLRLSVSTTTRSARPGEQDGIDYHFVSEQEFERRVAEGKFTEHARFGRHRYGTESYNVRQAELDGGDLVLDIDVQGARHLRMLFPAQVVIVCVFPPSFKVLEQRFRARGTDDEARIRRRLEMAEEEVRSLREPGFSDFLLLNEGLEKAVALARSIVEVERCRFSRFRADYLNILFAPLDS